VPFIKILLPGILGGGILAYFAWASTHYLPERLHPEGPADVTVMLAGLVFIFAFILGIAVSAETSTIGTAGTAASKEANSLGELWWYAHALPEPEHSQLHGLLRSYATIMVSKDWPLLGRHQIGPEGSAALRAIREDVLNYTPVTAKEQALYPNELTEVANLFEARRTRRDIVISGGIPPILIDGIIVLAILMLIGIPLSGSLHKTRDLVLYGLFCALTIATLGFVVDLNNPFHGTVQVGPDALINLIGSTFKNVS